jgi:hypothetical protein
MLLCYQFWDNTLHEFEFVRGVDKFFAKLVLREKSKQNKIRIFLFKKRKLYYPAWHRKFLLVEK